MVRNGLYILNDTFEITHKYEFHVNSGLFTIAPDGGFIFSHYFLEGSRRNLVLKKIYPKDFTPVSPR